MMGALFIFSIFASCLVVMAASDDEAYYLLLNNTKDSFGAFMGSFSGKTGSDSETTAEGYETITLTSTGLNLDLIDRIPDVDSGAVGYVRELLSIYRDAQNGKIVKGAEIPLATLLAIHINEVGFNSSSIGKVPAFHFKIDDWKKDTPNYCVKDFTTKSLNVIGENQVKEGKDFGIFQHQGSASLDRHADIDPLSVSRISSKGDARFVPDAISQVNYLYSLFLDSCKSKKLLSTEEATIIAGASNNRGGAGMARYSMGLADYDDKYRINKLTKTAVACTISPMAKMFSDYYNSYADKFDIDKILTFEDAHAREAAVLVALFCGDDDWYIDQLVYNFIEGHWSTTMEVYKSLFPDKYKIDKNGDDLKAELQGMISKSIAKSIAKTTNDSSVTDSDCAIVYGVSKYADWSYRHTWGGSLWHVSTEKDADGVYKYKYSNGNRPYYIFSVDLVSAGYLYDCSGLRSKFVYAELLQQCGVNSVDPTNPSTYIGTVTITVKKQIQTTVTPPVSQQWSGELDSIYKDCDIDQTKLTPDRIAVLNAAADMAYHKPVYYTYGGKGVWKTGSKGDVGWQMDCANFTFYSYYFAGFNKKGQVAYHPTSEFPGSSDYTLVGTNNPKDALPGDSAWKFGHVELFIAYKKGSSNTMQTIGAHTSDYVPKEQVSLDLTKTIIPTVYRLKVIDKGKRGEPIEIPSTGKSGDYIAGKAIGSLP